MGLMILESFPTITCIAAKERVTACIHILPPTVLLCDEIFWVSTYDLYHFYNTQGIRPPQVKAISGNRSITVYISRQLHSLPWRRLMITVERIVGKGQLLCPDYIDAHYEEMPTLAQAFYNLEEFSTYNVTVFAGYTIYGTPSIKTTTLLVNTLIGSKW